MICAPGETLARYAFGGHVLPFNLRRFEIYSKDLSAALWELRDEMGLSELKGRLSHIEGIEALTHRHGPNGTEIYSIGDRTIEIPAGNAAKRNRIQYLADGLMEKPNMSEPATVIEPNEFKQEPIKKNLTGASFLANLIRTQQAAIKAQLSQAGTELTQAMTELQDTANEATNQVKAVKAETADLKAALGLNSNGE